ncbi:hypothetical protein V6R21_30525 [Limibacter armeniacum]|uniref:hypothetical protein n=1 Tax=Limibacter armeniacum TaxID=466084 RepID=UPI002FE68870
MYKKSHLLTLLLIISTCFGCSDKDETTPTINPQNSDIRRLLLNANFTTLTVSGINNIFNDSAMVGERSDLQISSDENRNNIEIYTNLKGELIDFYMEEWWYEEDLPNKSPEDILTFYRTEYLDRLENRYGPAKIVALDREAVEKIKSDFELSRDVQYGSVYQHYWEVIPDPNDIIEIDNNNDGVIDLIYPRFYIIYISITGTRKYNQYTASITVENL